MQSGQKLQNEKGEKNEKYVADYLSFLGCERQPVSLYYLSQLMEAHIEKVPFDGSDFTLHQPQNYSLKNRKILAGFKQGKGGICYQENGAFKKLLHLLGFNVTLVSATMFRYGRDEPVPYAAMGWDVHCAIIVDIDDKEYLVDVLWGNAVRLPLEIGGECTDIPGEDKRRCIKKEDSYRVEVELDGIWETEYEFKNSDKKTKDFKKNVEFLAINEHSELSQTLLLMQRLPGGGFDFIKHKIHKDNNGFLFFHHKSLSQEKPVKIKITDREIAAQEIRKFGVSEQNTDELLTRCGFIKKQ